MLSPQPFHWKEQSWGEGLLGLGEQTPVHVTKAPTWQPGWQENGVWWASLGEAGKSPTLHRSGLSAAGFHGNEGAGQGPWPLFSSLALGPGPLSPAW